ncbi:hypothetical protein [Pandoraea terrae]|nr:hypothetical protein [Pandoraea terrae]
MDAVDKYEQDHGIYPVALDRRRHTGIHLKSDILDQRVHAIADGEVVAYRVCEFAIDGGDSKADSNAGFVLLKHTTETGEGRALTFYSLYMHLLDLDSYPIDVTKQQLPEFLRTKSPGGNRDELLPPPAQAGNGLMKVQRKDVLGLRGACQGWRHLHFEIFMTKKDFDEYFGPTQLGKEQVVTPATSDYWGHSYFVIPEDTQFFPLPPDADANGKLGDIAFEKLQVDKNKATLYVEAWFHKGQKYTKVWRDEGNGQLRLLTMAQPGTDKSGQPLERLQAQAEKDYEYTLYDRAMALYKTCPSDGYELLRFGRILSKSDKLPEGERATWMRVTFDDDKQGYVDINNAKIKKLSDADFPFFKGWQKLDEANGPFDADGLCDIDALKALMCNAKERYMPEALARTESGKKAEALARYVRTTKGVREQLRGFICEAPSEWDSSNNEQRFGKLKAPGEHFEGDEKGYGNLLKRVESLQFWDETGLTPGEKLWFFHPLAFIRHFRKCGWRSLPELAQMLPRKSSVEAGGLIEWGTAVDRWQDGETSKLGFMPPNMYLAMNRMWPKYGFTDPQRQAHFLAQIFKETGALRSTVEYGGDNYFRTKYEVLTEQEAGAAFDSLKAKKKAVKYSREDYIKMRIAQARQKAEELENTQPGDGARFRGRGLIHLTGRGNYRKYGRFRKSDFTTDPKCELISTDAFVAADSAGYFWVSKWMVSKDIGASRGGRNISRRADLGVEDDNVHAISVPVNGINPNGPVARKQFFRYANFILGDLPSMPADRDLVRQTDDSQQEQKK